jgi:hypothetical protein
MTTTYTWLVEQLDCVPSLDKQTNVVSVVHWRLNGTNDTHNATVYGTQYLPYIESNLFTEYSDLTLETVIAWVQAAMGNEQIQAIKTDLDSQIVSLTNPPIISPALPWEKYNVKEQEMAWDTHFHQ